MYFGLTYQHYKSLLISEGFIGAIRNVTFQNEYSVLGISRHSSNTLIPFNVWICIAVCENADNKEIQRSLVAGRRKLTRCVSNREAYYNGEAGGGGVTGILRYLGANSSLSRAFSTCLAIVLEICWVSRCRCGAVPCLSTTLAVL